MPSFKQTYPPGSTISKAYVTRKYDSWASIVLFEQGYIEEAPSKKNYPYFAVLKWLPSELEYLGMRGRHYLTSVEDMLDRAHRETEWIQERLDAWHAKISKGISADSERTARVKLAAENMADITKGFDTIDKTVLQNFLETKVVFLPTLVFVTIADHWREACQLLNTICRYIPDHEAGVQAEQFNHINELHAALACVEFPGTFR